MKFFRWTFTLKREENRLMDLEEARKLLGRWLGHNIIYEKGKWLIRDQKATDTLIEDTGDFLDRYK